MDGKTLIGLVVAFATGIAVGCFCVKRDPGVRRSVEEEDASPVRADDGELKFARRRIVELERRIAASSERQAVASPMAAEVNGEIGITIDDNSATVNEVLAKRLPNERFHQVTNAFERMRQNRMERVRGRVDFLSSIDLVGVSAADRATHEQYLKTVNELEELMDRSKGIFHSGDTSTRFAELSAQMKSLADAERKVLLRQMSVDLGYGEEDASVVIGTVEDILKATSSGYFGTGPDGSECLFLKIE